MRPRPGWLVTHVDQVHLRQRPIQHALRQAQQTVLAAVGVVPAFQRGRRRAEQDRDVFQAGTHDGHVAGMVARRRFLLEGALVLLVDDDEAEFARWSEHSAAGPTIGRAVKDGSCVERAPALAGSRSSARPRPLSERCFGLCKVWGKGPAIPLITESSPILPSGASCLAGALELPFPLATKEHEESSMKGQGCNPRDEAGADAVGRFSRLKVFNQPSTTLRQALGSSKSRRKPGRLELVCLLNE